MPVSRREILKSLAPGVPALQLHPALALSRAEGSMIVPPPAGGPFAAARASLRTYEIPEWYRNAKFGIRAHWGPQSAVEAGDWYARKGFIYPGCRRDEDHVAGAVTR